jgi:hypothetical protein
VLDEPCRDLECEASLADAARAGERDQAGCSHERMDLIRFVPATDEGADLGWQVVPPVLGRADWWLSEGEVGLDGRTIPEARQRSAHAFGIGDPPIVWASGAAEAGGGMAPIC